MSPEVTFEPATLAHCAAMAPRMRAADAAECRAFGWEPLEALSKSLGDSSFAEAVLFNGEVAAIYGVTPIPHDERGCAWALTSSAVDAHPFTFLRVCRPALGKLLARCPRLLNFVDARYAKSLRWLKSLGFDVRPAEPFGTSGLPFHPVVFGR